MENEVFLPLPAGNY